MVRRPTDGAASGAWREVAGMMTLQLQEALHAAQDRKALDLSILDLERTCSFTSYFLICTGTSARHTQAICDAIAENLKKKGFTPAHIEGYAQAEWILMDYLNLVVHIFVEHARQFYDLERLWKNAPRIPIPEQG
jgi:ribosome-associated protein